MFLRTPTNYIFLDTLIKIMCFDIHTKIYFEHIKVIILMYIFCYGRFSTELCNNRYVLAVSFVLFLYFRNGLYRTFCGLLSSDHSSTFPYLVMRLLYNMHTYIHTFFIYTSEVRWTVQHKRSLLFIFAFPCTSTTSIHIQYH